MSVEHLVEEARGADKTVEVFEAFEVRSYLEQQLVGEPQERGLAADAFCGTHSEDFLPDTTLVGLMWWMHASVYLIYYVVESVVTRSRYVAQLVEPACLVASGSEDNVQETRREGAMVVGRKLCFGVELVESVLEGWREEGASGGGAK
jgi:hypothetical protein